MKEDTQKTIGQLLTDETLRDAIHIAVVPVIAAQDLWPGRKVKLVYGSTNTVALQDYGGHIGVIDPFLPGMVRKGQKCWLFLTPNTVTGMRHEWTHPEFDQPHVAAGESEEWLRNFASKWNFDYNEMLAEAQTSGGMAVAMGVDLHGAGELAAGDEDWFWTHFQNLTGKTYGPEHRNNFIWSCSC